MPDQDHHHLVSPLAPGADGVRLGLQQAVRFLQAFTALYHVPLAPSYAEQPLNPQARGAC